MKNKKIVIAGGTGFIGQALCNWWGAGNELIVLTRRLPHQKTNAFGENNIPASLQGQIRYVQWDAAGSGEWEKELDGAHLLVNLAGKTVNCRYTDANKKEIFESRTRSTSALGAAVRKAVQPPKLWINAASATIYPHATDTPRDETFTNFANDFSVQVCRKWEQTFYEERTPFTRKIALRMAITLGAGGVMIPYFNLLKFGWGGRQGRGDQRYSWVHVTDTCRMIDWLFEHPELEGTFNCCSPGAVTNSGFMRTLRDVTGCKSGLPAPAWLLKAGAVFVGTETELVLKSRWVYPARILATGFRFRYPGLKEALEEIVDHTERRRYHLF